MTFHTETIRLLSGSLQKYSAELKEAERKLAKAQRRVDEKAAIVADCVRFLDFAELCDSDNDLAHAFANAVLNRDAEPTMSTRPDVASILTDLQSNGLACSRCGLLFLEGQSSRPTGTGSHGQLFAHANLSDCAEAGR